MNIASARASLTTARPPEETRPRTNTFSPSSHAGVLTTRRLRAGIRRALNPALVLLTLANLGVSVASAQTSAPSITSPTADQAVQGQVSITGATGASSFASAELDFAYAEDRTNTWFLIQAVSQPVEDGTLASWDTLQITDGNYILRLRVFTTDGTFEDATVPFEISNYTVPILASATPAPTNPQSVQIPTPLVIVGSATPAPLVAATPTPLPPNPVGLPTDLVFGELGRGALFVLAAFLVLGVLLLRRRS